MTLKENELTDIIKDFDRPKVIEEMVLMGAKIHYAGKKPIYAEKDFDQYNAVFAYSGGWFYLHDVAKKC